MQSLSISPKFRKLVKEALKEDIGKGDITTRYLGIGNKIVHGKIIAKEKGIIAGIPIAKLAFKIVDPKVKFTQKYQDGQFISKGKVVAQLKGKACSILSAERTALNFLQHLSGIATLTAKFAKVFRGIYDTRKTIPLLRAFEKYAVRIGGGKNHRFGLDSAILIKDNHIRIAGSIKNPIANIRKKINAPIEVEVKNFKELKEALESKADIIMLDNMNLGMIKKAVKMIKNKAVIEVSGGVNLKNIKKLAKLGVDRISVGAITHSAKALDFSLEIYG